MHRFFSFSYYIFKVVFRARTVYATLFASALAVIVPFWFGRNGDSTAQSVISSMKFSMIFLGMTVFIGSVCCATIFSSGQIESWRAHLLRVRPVPPILIVFAQITGIFWAFLLPLLASITLFAGVSYYSISKLSDSERQILMKQVFSVKEKIMAELPDFQVRATAMADEQIRKGGLPEGFTRKSLINNYFGRLLVRSGELAPGGVTELTFKNVDVSGSRAFVKYRLNVGGNFDPEMKVFGDVAWFLRHPVSGEFYPMKGRFQSGKWDRFEIHPDFVSEEGEVLVGIENIDEQKRVIYFGVSERPELVIEKNGVWLNVLRGLVFSTFILLFFVALGVMSGTLFSTPVALFFCFVYMFLGGVADLELLRKSGLEFMEQFTISPFSNEVVARLSEGIEVSLSFLLFRGFLMVATALLLSTFAAQVLSRRELALVFRRR